MVIEFDKELLDGLPEKRQERIKRSMDNLHLDDGVTYIRNPGEANEKEVQLFILTNYKANDIRRLIDSLARTHDKNTSSELDSALNDTGEDDIGDNDAAKLVMKGYRIGWREARGEIKTTLPDDADDSDFDAYRDTTSIPARFLRFHKRIPKALVVKPAPDDV